MTRSRIGPLALSLASGIAMLACSEEAAPEKVVAQPVKILELGAAGGSRVLEYPGQIEAAQHAELGFEVPGQIQEFPIDEGQVVAEGEVLAKLDPRDYQANLDADLANHRQAQTEFSRETELFEKEVASQQDVERAKRRYEVTAAKLRTTEKALQDAVLRAPFAGRVAKKLVKDFRNVQAKEPVLILQDDAALQIVVNIPERDMALSRPSDSRGDLQAQFQPRVTVSTFPDLEFPARLKELSTTADPATRTFAVTLSFSVPEDVSVLPGMTAKVSLDAPGTQGGRGHSVPARAVIQDEGSQPYVWKVQSDMTVSKATVVVGELSGDEIEVTGGVDTGDQIATSGVHQLREGMPVRRFGN